MTPPHHDRRRRWSLYARGAIVAYLVGLALSVMELDPRRWSEFVQICATCFLIGWVVVVNKELDDGR
jgi:hypothetical protein